MKNPSCPPRNSPRKRSSGIAGQALLIILLVMAVALTIALSIASRSIIDITISQKEEESARAFSAAEAGIEQALLGGPSSGTLPSGGAFSVTTATVSTGTEFSIPLLLNSGEVAPVWLVSHDNSDNLVCTSSAPCFTGDTLKICWGLEGTSSSSDTTPALEASILYTGGSGSSSTPKIARGAYEPNGTRLASNKFESIDPGACSIGGTNFAFSKTVSLRGLGVSIRNNPDNMTGPQFARLRLLYNTDRAHPIGVAVVGAGSLPNQGTKIESVGTVGDITRRIEFFRLFSDLPPIFDSALVSGIGGIAKTE